MLMNETSLDGHLCTVLLEKGNGKTPDFGMIFHWIISKQRGNKRKLPNRIRLVTDPFWSSDLSLLYTPKQRSEAVLYTKRQIL